MSATDAPAADRDIKENAASPPPEPEKETTPSFSEFDVIFPSLSKGTSIRIGKREFQLHEDRDPGVEVRIRPVRLRESLLIGRILTGNTRPLDLHALIRPVMEAKNEIQTEAAFYAAVAQLVVTVPHSEDDFVQFINQVIDPVSKMDKNEFGLFARYMNNPELEDTVLILMQAYKNEEGHVGELLKALLALRPQPTGAESKDESDS